MPLPATRPRSRPRSLVASASTMEDALATQYSRRLGLPWQRRALEYMSLVPEINYASRFYARMLRKVKLYPGMMDANERITRIDEGAPVDLLSRIKDPGGGRANILGQYARLMFSSGEGILFGRWLETPQEKWDFVWNDELQIVYGGDNQIVEYLWRPSPREQWQTFYADGAGGEPKAVGYRMWTPSPAMSAEADSPMRAALDICVAEGSLVNTLRGPIPIEDVRKGDFVFAWGAGGISKRPVVRHIDRGKQEVIKIVAGRRTVRVTAEHPLLVMRKTFPGKGKRATYECEWVEASEIRKGDHLVALDHVPDYGTPQAMPDGTQITEDIAWLLGHVVGDGHVHQDGLNIAAFDEGRADRMCKIVKGTWGLRNHQQGGSCRWFSRDLRRCLEAMGLRVKSHKKVVPAEILASPKSIKRAFLSGYEEADGHLTKEGWQSLAATSPDLIRDLRGLYIEMGENVSNVHVETRAGSAVLPDGSVSMNAEPLSRFQVYRNSPRKGAKNVIKSRAAREAIGGENFTIATVKSVEVDGVCQTYDLEVEGDHTYIADGVVSHNCEELVLLTAAVRSTAVSRLLMGMLVIPTELSPNPAAVEGDEDPMNNPFLQDLTEHITSQIENPGSAAALSPFLVEAAYDYIDRIRMIPLHDPQNDYMEKELRKEAIQRLAYGLDMPPEALTGIGESNHWAARQILDDMWVSHGAAVAQQFAQDLAAVYLRPALAEIAYPGWENITIMVDPSEVTVPPDRSQDADQAADRGYISAEGYRALKNIPEHWAPSEDERKEFLAIKMRDPLLLDTGVAPPEPNGTPPAPGPEGDSGRRTRVVRASAVSEFAGAAALAVTRCRELAGVRLRQREKHCPECIRMANGAANAHVAAVLGEVQMARLRLEPLDAVRGGADTLRTFLAEQEIPLPRVEALADLIEVFSARTLFEQGQPRLPDEIVEQFEREEIAA